LTDLLGGKIPFGPVYNVAEVFADPHIAAREMIVKVAHPGLDREMSIAGIPLKMTGTPGRVARRAPMVGEHTGEILREIGIPEARVSELRAQGSIG